jgi:hypothetical protein
MMKSRTDNTRHEARKAGSLLLWEREAPIMPQGYLPGWAHRDTPLHRRPWGRAEAQNPPTLVLIPRDPSSRSSFEGTASRAPTATWRRVSPGSTCPTMVRLMHGACYQANTRFAPTTSRTRPRGVPEGRSPSAFFVIPQEWGTKGLMTSPRASDVSMTDSASGGFCYTVHLDSRLRGNDRGSHLWQQVEVGTDSRDGGV